MSDKLVRVVSGNGFSRSDQQLPDSVIPSEVGSFYLRTIQSSREPALSEAEGKLPFA